MAEARSAKKKHSRQSSISSGMSDWSNVSGSQAKMPLLQVDNVQKKKEGSKGGSRTSARRSSRASSIASSRRKKAESKKSYESGNVYYTIVDPLQPEKDRTPVPLISDSGKQGQSREGRSASIAPSGSTTPTSSAPAELHSEISGLEMDKFSLMASSRGGDSQAMSRTGSTTPRSSVSEESIPVSVSMWEDSVAEITGPKEKKEKKEKEDEEDEFHERRRKIEVVMPDEREGPLTEEDLEKEVLINIVETDTIFLFDKNCECVQSEEDIEELKKRKEEYEKLKELKVGNDKYVDRGMQTFNLPQRASEVQASVVGTSEKEVMATSWEIYDATKAEESEESDVEDTENVHEEESEDEEGSEDEEEGWEGDFEEEGSDAGELAETASYASSFRSGRRGGALKGSMQETLSMLERVVVHNIRRKKQLYYYGALNEEEAVEEEKEVVEEGEAEKKEETGEEEAEERTSAREIEELGEKTEEAEHAEEKEEGVAEEGEGEGKPEVNELDIKEIDENRAHLEHLWTYECKLSSFRKVTCMSWNRKCEDLLAVGYDKKSNIPDETGMILCWSVKNPLWPARHFQTSVPVTSIDFSSTRPYLLGVGFKDGTVALYDVRTRSEKPGLVSNVNSGKHLDTVWQVMWVTEESGAEKLVSISADGRVMQWGISKGLEATELNRLKQVANPARAGMGAKSDAFISRQAGGLSLDFSRKDSSIYLAGTEDGTIHKCSSSYSEQYLQNYFGHTGPVYKIQWSPFHDNFFLSCSADWTINLWNTEKDKPSLTFEPSTESVTGIEWCPFNSRVFGSCTGDGKVQLWDLKENILDPVFEKSFEGRSVDCIKFAPNTNAFVCGESSGKVEVFKAHGIEAKESFEEQKIKLERAIVEEVSFE